MDTVTSGERALACEALCVRVPGRSLVEALSIHVRPGTGRARVANARHALASGRAAPQQEVVQLPDRIVGGFPVHGARV